MKRIEMTIPRTSIAFCSGLLESSSVRDLTEVAEKITTASYIPSPNIVAPMKGNILAVELPNTTLAYEKLSNQEIVVFQDKGTWAIWKQCRKPCRHTSLKRTPLQNSFERIQN